MKKYIATFYARDEKTNKLTNVGTQEIWTYPNDTMSRVGKAFSQAQGKQKDAVTVEFEEID